MDVDAVVFDLDDTLCVREQDLAAIIASAFERVDVEPFYGPADVRAVDYAALPPAGSLQEFYEHSIRAIAENVGADPSHAPALAAATVDVVDETDVAFREGAESALAYVRDQYDVGLITNGGTDTQTEKLATLGIDDDFDATVFCNPTTGIPGKPDPEPFRRVLDDLGATPDRTVFVGNSHEEDVAGAHAAGLQSVWIPREGAELTDPRPAPTYELDSMAELPDVLRP